MPSIVDARVLRVAPRWLFVRVECDDGYVGWGEAIIPKRAAAVTGAVEDLFRNIAGANANRIDDLVARMRIGGFFRDGPVLTTAAAAIEHALWDIKGQRHQLPIHEFLGGAVRDRIPVYAWVRGDEPDDVVAQVRTRISQGFTAVKVAAAAEMDYVDRGAKVDQLVARLAAIREKFGTTVGIAVDFHGRVHRAMAKVLLRELEQFDLMWVEEPLLPEHTGALHEIARAAAPVPLATGERLVNRAQFARLLEQRVVDIIQPDVSMTGLFELEKICRMAEAYDVAVAPHCPNGPISLAASLQVASCCGNVFIQETSLGLHYRQDDEAQRRDEVYDYLVDPSPLAVVDGHIGVQSGLGLGIMVDEGAVRSSPTWTLTDPECRLPDGRLAEW